MAIRCLVVTPEKTELDVEARFLTLPMYDGELGVAPGRAPLIGRLGYGILRIETDQGTQRWFIDGGFAQVEEDVVSVLTSRAIVQQALDAAAADAMLEEAISLPGGTFEKAQLRDTALLRARGMARAARTAK